MTWDFETDPAFQDLIDWATEFVRDEVEPLDFVIATPYDVTHPVHVALIPPLQAEVRAKGLWAGHLEPHLGGQGWGQVKLGLLNEVLGPAMCGPFVFGCQAPDSGNSEILARFGTVPQKDRFLAPLLRSEIVSAFSMTEPDGGADPTLLKTAAVADGDEWVINGEKWFTTSGPYATFFIVMTVTDPQADKHKRATMFIVPRDTAGIEFVRHVGGWEDPPGQGEHSYIRFNDVRVPDDLMLGSRGGGFAVAQTRLGGGRIHHAMRAVGQAKRLLDMMCERAVSRQVGGGMLGGKQLVEDAIAESWFQLEQFRLLVLQTAWKIDRFQDYQRVRADISAVKFGMEQMLKDIAGRALHLHGSLGWSNEMPFLHYLSTAFMLGLADGPTEVHKSATARLVLRAYEPIEGLWPSAHLPSLRAVAERKYASVLLETGCSTIR